MVLSAAHGDGLLLLLVGSIGLHLAGDHLGLGDIVAAAVGDGQNQVALIQAGLGHDVLVVDGLVGVEAVQSGGLLGGALGDDLGQGLLEVQHVLNLAVVIVVDGGQLHAVAVGLALHAVEAVAGLEAHGLGGGSLALHHAVVDVVGGIAVHAQAGTLQEVLHGVLGVGGGLDHVVVAVHIHAQNLGVGQNGSLAHIHGHSLTQHVDGSGHVEDNRVLLRLILAHNGVAGGGLVDLYVIHLGLAGGQGVLAVGILQLGPLVAGDHALHLVHAVLSGQQGTVIPKGNCVAVLVLLDHFDVQSVVDQQRRVVAGQRIAGGSGQVIKDAQGRGQRGGLDGPVVAGQALELRVVAGGHQQHLGGLVAGNGSGGVKLAVAAAGDDAQAVAVVDIALSPVALHVGQAGVHPDIQAVHIGALIQDGGDHLRHLGTGHVAGGVKVRPVFLAVDHAQSSEHGNGILVDDFVLVGKVVEARSAGGDNHHADEHDRRQSQAESPLEVSHLDFLLLNFEPEGRTTPLTGKETMQFSGDRDIKGGETESKGYYGRRLVDNTGAGKVKTPWNPKDSKAFLVDFW